MKNYYYAYFLSYNIYIANFLKVLNFAMNNYNTVYVYVDGENNE